jgi:adenylate kinase
MNIIVVGPPGAGKGTQAAILAHRLRVPHVSTGEMFRAELDADSELGKKAKEYIHAGDLVPDSLTFSILSKRLENHDCRNGFILDGYPRSVEQAEHLQEFLTSKNIEVTHVIEYIVEDEIVTQRILKRAKKGKKLGNKVRDDDLDETVIKHRISTYHEKTEKLLSFYKSKVLQIDASGTIHEVLDATLQTLNG